MWYNLAMSSNEPSQPRDFEIIENKLLNLAIDGDTEATQQYDDLYLSRLDWERTRSAELRRDFLDHAGGADAWLAVNSL